MADNPSQVAATNFCTPDQKQAILASTARLVVGSVTRSGDLEGHLSADWVNLPVSGVFVCLKRGPHLRGCCGGLRQEPVLLGRALLHAVTRTVRDDPRFPPVSPTELDYLTAEVWLLFQPRPLAERGEDRLRAIEVGRHGLAIQHGRRHGLLLPGVPVEHGWDTKTFLERLCVKAGLGPDHWRDDASRLTVFKGESVRGRLSETLGPGQSSRRPAAISREDMTACVEYCRQRILAVLRRQQSCQSADDLPELAVAGLVLSVRAGANARLTQAQISLRPGIDLRATLARQAQLAAQRLQRAGVASGPSSAANLSLELCLFHDVAMHGTLASPDVGGLVAHERALLACAGTKKGVVFHPGLGEEEHLEWARCWAGEDEPAATTLYSVQVLGTAKRLALSLSPQPRREVNVRLPAVAEKFYPEDANELSHLVDHLLASNEAPGGRDSVSAALVPHAGLRFSGKVAGEVFRRLRIPRTVIILGPKHTSLGKPWAIDPHQAWALPGTTIAADPELAGKLARGITGLSLDHEAHVREHAIEVELPFIARLAPRSRVVGIVIGRATLEDCIYFADAFAEVLSGLDEPPLLLISSDMNHFASDAENRRRDGIALAALQRLDPIELYHAVRGNDISMCGVLPAVIVLETLRRLGRLDWARQVAYATSGEVSGDLSRVVGYAGVLFGLNS